MADTLATTLIASIEWLRKETLDLSTVYDRATLEYKKELADGTAVDTADIIWHDQRTIASAANDDLDLTALTQTIFGSTVTINFAKVKAILIKNRSVITGDELQLDSSVANGFTAWAGNATSKVQIGADSPCFLSAAKDGWTVTAGTGDILRISNPGGGTTITYDIAIIGTSA